MLQNGVGCTTTASMRGGCMGRGPGGDLPVAPVVAPVRPGVAEVRPEIAEPPPGELLLRGLRTGEFAHCLAYRLELARHLGLVRRVAEAGDRRIGRARLLSGLIGGGGKGGRKPERARGQQRGKRSRIAADVRHRLPRGSLRSDLSKRFAEGWLRSRAKRRHSVTTVMSRPWRAAREQRPAIAPSRAPRRAGCPARTIIDGASDQPLPQLCQLRQWPS